MLISVLSDVTEPLLVEVDRIYHLACLASPIFYKHNPVKTIKTNVIGTLTMLGLAKRVGARILLTSTSEVYGDPLEHPQEEEYWGNVNPIALSLEKVNYWKEIARGIGNESGQQQEPSPTLSTCGYICNLDNPVNPGDAIVFSSDFLKRSGGENKNAESTTSMRYFHRKSSQLSESPKRSFSRNRQVVEFW
ncbi:hypothetical protein OPV22_025421 [Ensete ventricosum]|uniref:UDP-glucuronate decarboxylase n=1 Tax=Ensete ventricosum TaxID=4639 RepID=A0AAV8QDT1_ENSVE|nr:hypothetical protein OPV22_025421 [Ensete ventricosum]